MDDDLLELTRQNTLRQLRQQRLPKLLGVDHAINAMVLGQNFSAASAWSTYRQALLDVTNPYKDYASDSGQAAALDSLDVSSFSWPTEPS